MLTLSVTRPGSHSRRLCFRLHSAARVAVSPSILGEKIPSILSGRVPRQSSKRRKHRTVKSSLSLKLIPLWLALTCVWPGLALGQTISPGRLLGRYQQFIWQDQHGLPQNGISAVAQTPEGYLWFASAEGVVRFDGVRFTVFDTGNTPEIKSNNVQALLVDRAGALWIGTHGGGVSRYQAGRFSNFSTAEGLSDSHVKSLCEDRAGNLWIGTDGGGVAQFKPGAAGNQSGFNVYTQREGLPNDHVLALVEDSTGALWLGTSDGLAQLKDGRFTVYKTKDGLPNNGVRALGLTRAGELWVGTNTGAGRFAQGRFTSAGVPAALMSQEVWAITQDRAGSLWFGAIGGLYRLQAGRFDWCTAQNGLVTDSVQAVYQTADGDLWLGTSGGGVVQLRTGRFEAYSTAEGLPDEMALAVFEDRQGVIWVGTEGGLSRFEQGRFVTVTTPSGQPVLGVSSIGEDFAGNYWLCLNTRTPGGQVLRWLPGSARLQTVELGPPYRTSAMLQDRAGGIWLIKGYDGVVVWRAGQPTEYHKRDGLADDYVTMLYEDRQGSVWIGTRSGMSRFRDGNLTTWTEQQGFNGNHILSFYEDAAGALWIGTHGYGLFRFKDGQFRVITTKQGLYDNLAFQILEDAAGNLWMSGNKGIYRANLQELNECAEGRRATVNSFSYGVFDGMLSRECNGGYPPGIKARDGRLWFPTIKGVVALDPQRINLEPPHVVIEQVRLDGETLPAGQMARIQPGHENLEIQYTALSWSRPQQLKFKYQLVGLDQVWHDAGTRRTAYYPHLPPGNYTFRVSAENGEGIWNETGASFTLVVVPPFYRTWWFRALVSLGLAGLVLAGYKWRVRQLERANAAQQEFSRRLLNAHEGERQRIAAELHDGLSQSLAIIRQRATICLQATDDPARQLEQMEEIAESATAVIDEVRDIIYDLRPVQLDRLGLVNSLREMLDKVGRAHGLNIEPEFDELAGRLSKESENSLYRIVQEAVNNIVRHAHASQASVRLSLQPGALRLVIADNGCGFIPDATRDWVAGSGLGLTGIHERTRLLRGELLVESAPQQGTTLTILLPLSEQPS
jgi:ligand-binding sensor domain-containing protein/signal transduction histidine kinase